MIFLDKMESKYGMFRLILLEAVGAFLLGLLVGNSTKGTFLTNQKYMDAMLLTDFVKLNKVQLLIFVLQNRLKDYLLLWLFSVTVLCIPYNIGFTIIKGFSAGFVLACFSSLYGVSGFFQAIFLGLPQMLFYIPIFTVTLIVTYKIHERVLNGLSSRKVKVILEQLPVFLFLLATIVLGCFLETFLNPVLLEWIKSAVK